MPLLPVAQKPATSERFQHLSTTLDLQEDMCLDSYQRNSRAIEAWQSPAWVEQPGLRTNNNVNRCSRKLNPESDPAQNSQC